MNITQEGEEQRKRAEDMNAKPNKYVWVLDPGHGGMLKGEYQTKGKRSPIWEDGSQYFEGQGNRQIAEKVGNKLDALGIDFIYTVEPTDPSDISLKARVNFVNKLPVKNMIGVSIHSNGFSKESANGWEIWTSVGETDSDKVATIFYNRFQDKFMDRNFRSDSKSDDDVDKESHFTIITKTNCPFVLLENFFMTNEAECKEILMTEEGQNKIVKAIVESICFIEKNDI